MTPPTPMTRKELIELAALDAYGLLDEYEAALYTRCFHHASAPVQDEILRLQAEFAADTSLLPDELPPADLRQRVLDAVARAVEQDQARLAPIASIGSHQVTAASGNGAATAPRLRGLLFGSAGQFWRAAAFVLCGAVIVLAYFQREQQRHYNLLAELALNNVTHGQISDLLGPDLDYFLGHPRHVPRVLRPENDSAASATLLFVEAEDGEAETPGFLLAVGLPRSQERYVLRLVEGETRTPIASFLSNGVVAGVKVSGYSTRILAAATFEVTNAAGTVVLRTA